MFGTNPKLAPEKSNGDFLQIVSIFHTIQAEGPYAGWPAIFIRLGGCNLSCNFCDTEFDIYTKVALKDIIEELSKYPNTSLVVITGGEPFRQSIGPLCRQCIDLGYKVQIESNGTIYREVPQEVEVVCSPKRLGGGRFHIANRMYPHIKAFKFLVSTTRPFYNTIPNIVPMALKDMVYIQPMDEMDKKLNADNINLAVRIVMESGYKLSLQIHKMIGLP